VECPAGLKLSAASCVWINSGWSHGQFAPHFLRQPCRFFNGQRHAEVTVLFDEPISKRDYDDWSMGFLYDATLSDEIEQALTDSTPQSDDRDAALARKIFLHVSDLARP
jgi:hypothetical protein